MNVTLSGLVDVNLNGRKIGAQLERLTFADVSVAEGIEIMLALSKVVGKIEAVDAQPTKPKVEEPKPPAPVKVEAPADTPLVQTSTVPTNTIPPTATPATVVKTNGELSAALAAATKLRDIVGILKENGFNTLETLTAECVRIKDDSETLKRITDLPDRVRRTWEAMS